MIEPTRSLQIWVLIGGLLLAVANNAVADYSKQPAVQAFIDQQVNEHGLDRQYLQDLFAAAEKKESILEAIARPAEKTLEWHQYRAIFMTLDRIQAGREFIQRYAEPLARAEQEYGVPPAMIAAIIGVETRYGRFKGRYRVLDALTTLAFDYPPRSAFFTSELEAYLLMVREQGFDPREVQGSYAGAMGYGQFIASSYRAYAVDFDGDGVADIINNPVDAIGSVANYFHRHGWRPQELIAVPVSLTEQADRSVASNALKPFTTVAAIGERGFQPQVALSDDEAVTVLALVNEDDIDYWLGLTNFYVITRYNHSHLYAMAVFQLAEALAEPATASAVDNQ